MCLSIVLQGCESEYERHLRWSCHWNPDIKLKGCDRWAFKDCVDHCEFCLGGLHTPVEGRSDQCAQLQCGAYCARHLDADCLDTYRPLCEAALQALAAGDSICAVDCSPATRPGSTSPVLALAALAALLPAALARSEGRDAHATGPLPAPALRAALATATVAALLLLLLLLEGCSASCPRSIPSLHDWQADLTRLDRDAGCQDRWDWKWGNPCAYDVPVLFAKKGIERDTDEAFITGHVENKVYKCVDRSTGISCHKWTSFEESCAKEQFGVCTCKQPSNNSKYCHSWQCISKRASQYNCWESCCGISCTPCVKCGSDGSSRFPMSLDRYNALMVAEGTSSVSLVGQHEALTILRRSYWLNFDFEGECIVPRRVKYPAEIPCKSWREIETEIVDCKCQRHAGDHGYCHAWSCAEKETGMFAVLFAKATSYVDLIDDAASQGYECIEAAILAGGVTQCRVWQGHISRYEVVETSQCKATCSDSSCDTWKCNEYSLPRVHDEPWSKRLAFCLAHSLWMCLPLLIVSRGQTNGSRNVLGLSPCGLLLVCFLIWAIGFLRWVDHEGRWRAPGRPFLGLLVTLGPAWLIMAPIWLCGSCDCLETLSPLVIVLPVMLLVGMAWTSGLIMVCSVLGFLILCILPLCVRRCRKRQRM